MSFIKNIELKNFRNFKALNLNFKEGVNLIIGKNGQGKTSILEAMSLCISGNSFRPGKYDSYINFDEPFSKVNCHFINGHLKNDIEYKITADKKSISHNLKKISTAKLSKINNYVLFSPESLSVIKNGPEVRRELIDDLLASLSDQNDDIIKNFKKALKSRNKVLRDCKKEIITQHEAIKVLNSLDEIYLNCATKLICKRIEVIHKTLPYVNNAFKYISNDKNVDISVDYIISSEINNSSDHNLIYEKLQTKRTQVISAEMALGTSLVGPHKHDIQFLYNGKDSRYYCSQGQQRALILAVKMAQTVYHYGVFAKYPILLLDDVMSELDETKRYNLLNFLKGINAQIFITTTEFDLQNQIDHSNLSVYEIIHGQVIENNPTEVIT